MEIRRREGIKRDGKDVKKGGGGEMRGREGGEIRRRGRGRREWGVEVSCQRDGQAGGPMMESANMNCIRNDRGKIK